MLREALMSSTIRLTALVACRPLGSSDHYSARRVIPLGYYRGRRRASPNSVFAVRLNR
jgi:hypothetical protein